MNTDEGQNIPARAPFTGSHAVYVTLAEAERGYPKARERIAGYDTPRLVNEYREMWRASSNRFFGHNARVDALLLADELAARGITHLANLFGDIEIKVTNLRAGEQKLPDAARAWRKS